MTTSTEYRTQADQARQSAADSFDRCDTDGFLSQWASGLTAQQCDANAKLADDGGKMEHVALFTLDGEIASTHQGSGQYGPFWVLNDAAAEKLGRRFVSESSASKAATRQRNNAKKGFTVGTIRVDGYVTIAGSGQGLAGAMTCHVVVRPSVDALIAGDFEVLSTDAPGEDW